MMQKGITLIELMAVISIAAVLGVLGIVGFASYNRTQILETSANEVASMINLAKSRAQSQIKPPACIGDLKGYVVKTDLGKNYELHFRCSNEMIVNEQDKRLPSDLNFTSANSFFFPVGTGKAEPTGQIVISNSAGKTKTVVVKN